MTPSQGARVRSAPSIGALMALIAAGAFGFWMFLPVLRQEAPYRTFVEWLNFAWIISVGVLGGLSLVGPPLLLWESKKTRRRWGPGKYHWFVQGTATWLMWPPVLYHRTLGPPGGARHQDSMNEICYFYGTPMMGLYVLVALLAGGRLRRLARRRLGPSWRERFGLVMGLLWALVGLGVLVSLYVQDLRL
jgi:hypothetical protein